MTQLCNYDNESLEMLRKSVSLLYELRNSKESFSFGAYTINVKEIFYITPLTFAFVNISPILPGHILVSPRRVVSLFTNLTREEVIDLMLSVQVLGKIMKDLHKREALNISFQDGKEAGQTVPHVHCHVIPRFENDFSKPDQIYDELDKHNASRNAKPDGCSLIERKIRTNEEMYQECEEIFNYIRKQCASMKTE